MTIRTIPQYRSIAPAAPLKRAEDRRRVLLFDGNDQSVVTAAPALDGLDIEVARASLSGPFEPSPRDVLAVVVTPRGDTATNDLVRHIRSTSALPVLILGPGIEDDVLLQELLPLASTPTNGLVPLELAQQIRSILRRSPSRVLRFGLLEIDAGAREVPRRPTSHRALEAGVRSDRLPRFVTRTGVHPARVAANGVALGWRVADAVDGHRARAAYTHQAADRDPDVPQWLVTVAGLDIDSSPSGRLAIVIR